MRRAAFAALVAATAASAQQPSAPVDPVVAHFRAYRAALDRNDLTAAEAAAAAALEASEAAAGSRTAVLALNLANLRLGLGADYDALTPARTAHTGATAAADSGVDTAAATLTLGRAELAAGDAAGAARLRNSLTAAEANDALAADAYLAAADLGLWSNNNKDYGAARQAWAAAARLAHAAGDATFARARALTGEGAAIFLANNDRTLLQPQGRIRVLSTPDAKAANDAFTIAQRLLMPAAFAASAGDLTAGQVAFAEALAWQNALFAKLQSDDEKLPEAPPFGNDTPPFDENRHCKLRTIRNGAEVEYPPAALIRYGVGAVVVRFGVDADGAVTSRTIAAAVPPGPLAEAVEAVAGQWSLEKDPASAPSCEMPPASYVSVRFVLG